MEIPMLSRLTALALSLVATLAPVAHAQSARVVVEAEQTQFKVTLPDGRVRRSPELVGAVLTLRSGDRVRIDAVERTQDERGRAIWLHTLSVADGGGWTNLCLAGPDGRRAGFPVPGRATADGLVIAAAPDVFELTCTAGAQAKCVRFGYRPWENAPDGTSLRHLYNACIRMVRADYGGDGTATTRDGITIDVYDTFRIQTPDLVAGHAFEAGWGPDGAVCVRHPRIREHVTLEQLTARFPRLAGRVGEICTEDFARAHGALLFNRSRP
jgi:hypothetical protein